MWQIEYQDRLQSWSVLRENIATIDLIDQLKLTAEWWGKAPITNHIIHWSDNKNWPSPWELLANDSYCELASALGIVYTIILNETFSANVVIAQAVDEFGNDCIIVLVNNYYILNWDINTVLNTEECNFVIKNTYDCTQLKTY